MKPNHRRWNVVVWDGKINCVHRRAVTFNQANRHVARLLKKGRDAVKVPA
jgi:hypothetical protein